MFRLESPNTSHEESYLEMLTEWKNFEITPTSPLRLFAGENFKNFLEIIESDKKNGRYPGVLATFYFMLDNKNRILGATQLKHNIDHPELIENIGHIAIGIRPTERGKGYGNIILSLGLIEARKITLEKVLICADEPNIASWKAIEHNGGIFERMTDDHGIPVRRYWIDLK